MLGHRVLIEMASQIFLFIMGNICTILTSVNLFVGSVSVDPRIYYIVYYGLMKNL